MTDLITRLEQAEEGSRELDYAIQYLVTRRGPNPKDIVRIHNQSMGEVVELAGGGASAGRAPPHYTTSLDAKLPWENIVVSRYLFVEEIWEALHHDEAEGEFIIGKGQTEVLARRIAALRAKANG